MRIVKPNAVCISDADRTEFEKIEMVGRTCYKSNDKITEGSAVKFVQGLEKSKHYAMLEHSQIYTVMSKEFAYNLKNLVAICNIKLAEKAIKEGKTTNAIGTGLHVTDRGNISYVSGSFRTFLELIAAMIDCNMYERDVIMLLYKLSNKFPELFSLREDTIMTEVDKAEADYAINILNKEGFLAFVKSTEKEAADGILSEHIMHTILFTTDRGVTHEFVRHRPASFAQESTRYCNYAKDKFGNEITVIEPMFEIGSERYKIWQEGCENDEKIYFKLIAAGCTAQEARGNLPTDVKTDLIITATEKEWQHIINLRYHGTTGAPHPKMKQVMSIAYPILLEISENRLK